jgi:hypothetical protein
LVNDDIEFREESEFEQEQKYSMKEIILRHIRKIGDICCKEFTGGYWEKKPIKTSSGVMFSEVYHDDVREAYCNAIDFLADIVYPMSDKKLKEYLNKYEGYGSELIKPEKKEIKEKLNLKRATFRQINLMFENNNFWKGTESYNE